MRSFRSNSKTSDQVRPRTLKPYTHEKRRAENFRFHLPVLDCRTANLARESEQAATLRDVSGFQGSAEASQPCIGSGWPHFHCTANLGREKGDRTPAEV